jgi:ABC-2 type transport system ATP-binding protein
MRDFVAGGRTVLFATHYLDERDAEATRIVVLAEGRIVADGNSAQIKSQVAGRTLSVAVESVDPAAVRDCPGVLRTEPSRVPAAGARCRLRRPPWAPCSGTGRTPATSR